MTSQSPPPHRTGQAAAGDAGQRPAVPLTGEQYELSAGDYRAAVTALGAGLRELTYRGRPLVASYQPDEMPPGASGQLLAPWPNRIDGGRYTFGGASYQLDLSEPDRGNAIHGLTRWAAWAPLRHDAGSVLLRHPPHGQPGYPFCVEIEAGYQLSPGGGLRVSITATNRGTRPAPFGTGSHPYLTAGAAAIDECELVLPASQWLPADERGIPSGPARDVGGTPQDFRRPRVIGTTRLDHALTGLSRDPDGRARAHLASGSTRVTLWAGEGYRWFQVFSGDTLDDAHRRKALAVEPMTCPPNAFVTGQDLITLQPGQRVTCTWGIEAHEG